MTLGQVSARFRWLLPAALLLFLLLAAGALFNVLPWDEPITRWLVSLRTPEPNAIVRRSRSWDPRRWSSPSPASAR